MSRSPEIRCCLIIFIVFILIFSLLLNVGVSYHLFKIRIGLWLWGGLFWTFRRICNRPVLWIYCYGYIQRTISTYEMELWKEMPMGWHLYDLHLLYLALYIILYSYSSSANWILINKYIGNKSRIALIINLQLFILSY